MAVREAIPRRARGRSGGLVLRQVALPRRDPRGARLPLAQARRPRSRSGSASSTPSSASTAPRTTTRAGSRRSAGSPTRSCATSARSASSASTSTRSTAARASRRPATRASSRRSAQIDATLAIVLGVHQSIGFKGISLFGTDEQKERWLPDLATGRKLAAFALTEPEAGSDAYNVQSRAVEQPDGSWVLNGEKRYIGNGSRADVITTFARAEVDGKDKHIALILEKGMEGLEVGERFDTMGLRGNDLRRLYFKDIRVPAENVLGEPGEGFRVAMQILNNGRIGLGTGSVGGAKKLLDLTIDHVKERRAVRPAARRLRAGPGQDRLDGLLPVRAGVHVLPDLRAGRRGRPRLLARVGDLQGLRDRVPLVRGQPLAPARRRRGLPARPSPRRRSLRDIRIFPIFEGANDVMRAFIALGGFKPVGEKLEGLGDIGLERPDRLDRGAGRLRGRPHPARGAPRQDHPRPRGALRPRRRGLRPGQAARATSPRSCCASTRRRSSSASSSRSASPTPSPTSSPRSRCSPGSARSSRTRASRPRARSASSPTPSAPAPPTGCGRNFDQIESNDDERMTAIAKLAYKRGEYGYALFED